MCTRKYIIECIKNNEFTKEELSHWIYGIPYQMKAEVEIDHSQLKDMVHSMLVDLNNGQEKDVYFYHSDHLGSASWITDYRGMAVQHIQYLPYGEPYINQHPFGYSERFTFTGKERDEETGYGYFGARYMDHELMTMWLSVDPMADKYPSISPYAYCNWNPVKLVDPDGRDVLPTSEEAYQVILSTLPVEARNYVKQNADGYIDRDLINSYSCESQNFNDLKELVNLNNCTVEVTVTEELPCIINGKLDNEKLYVYDDAEFLKGLTGVTLFENQKGTYSLSTGEDGNTGVTAYPTSAAAHQSLNGNIQVGISSQLSKKGRAETFAHEFFGHAYIFATTNSHDRSLHHDVKNTYPIEDGNIELKNRIIRAQNETISYNR